MEPTEIYSLLIFLIVLFAVGGYVLGMNRKKAKEKEPMKPAPKVVPLSKDDLFIYFGEANPSQSSFYQAIQNATKTRPYFSPYPVQAGGILYNNYPTDKTNGRYKYIGLIDEPSEKIYACKIDDQGNILEVRFQ